MDSNIILVGNPNTGKSSLFNILTGLNQKIGNYEGVTVDKREGVFRVGDKSIRVLDLPGLYSLHAQSITEKISSDYITNPTKEQKFDKIIFIADASNIKRNLFLLSQIAEIGNDVILALNMMDVMREKGINIDTKALKDKLDINVVEINAKTGQGIDEIKRLIVSDSKHSKQSSDNLKIISKLKQQDEYKTLQLNSYKEFIQLSTKSTLNHSTDKTQSPKYRNIQRLLSKEAIERYKLLNSKLEKIISISKPKYNLTNILDKILIHNLWGFFIFIAILFFIFQAIYTWSSLPMDIIEISFSKLSSFVGDNIPEGILSSLIIEGIIPGIAGVVIFIPQIAILFFIITLIEDTGYMSRIVFMMDRFMKFFGLNGKSIIPLVSGVACAIPAIMACRNIEDNKIRNITIMAVPFMTCSARLPVYVIIISLVIPNAYFMGLSMQGLVLLSMYLLGLLFAIITSVIVSKLTKKTSSPPNIFEMPSYKIPNFRNIFYSVIEKLKIFVLNAGKIIFAISIILWFMSNYSPKQSLIDSKTDKILYSNELNDDEKQKKINSLKLEYSYIGIMGKYIEPVIAPLGYDWKIGIALLASISAREVFVGTLLTIYSLQQEDKETLIRDKMRSEINPKTGLPVYNLAVGMSLMIFYALSMQCISTIAIVRRETKSIKFPILQFVFMTLIAYLCSFLAYNILI